MGLTAEIELQLTDAGLVDFYDENEDLFLEMAQRAYGFAADNIDPTGLPVRKDDVAAALLSALKVTEPLREFLSDARLRQQHWYQRFADLVMDRLWEDLVDGAEG